MNNIKLAYLIGIAGAISWGVSFIGTKTALDYMDPIQVMSVRMTVAVITFAAFILISSVKLNFKNKSIKNLLILSIAQPCLYGIFEIWGIDLTTASESAIILSMVPIVVTILSAVFFKEKIKFMTAGFVSLSFFGVIVTVMGDVSSSGKVLGYIFLLLAVSAAALYMLLSKQISGNFSPIEITFVMTIIGFVFFNGLNFMMGYGFEGYVLTAKTPELLLSILFLGVICSVFAFIAFNHLIATIPAYKASTLCLSIVTVTGVIAGIVFRGEAFTIYKIIGLVMILTGVVVVNQPEKLT